MAKKAGFPCNPAFLLSILVYIIFRYNISNRPSRAKFTAENRLRYLPVLACSEWE